MEAGVLQQVLETVLCHRVLLSIVPVAGHHKGTALAGINGLTIQSLTEAARAYAIRSCTFHANKSTIHVQR